MISLENKLEEYHDFELAFVFYYKLNSYTQATKEIVLREIRNRGLTNVMMKKMVNEKLAIKIKRHNSVICPRCTSMKILNTREMVQSQHEASEAMVGKEPSYKYNFICAICGWDFNKDKTKWDKTESLKIWIIVLAVSAIGSILINLLMNFIKKLQ